MKKILPFLFLFCAVCSAAQQKPLPTETDVFNYVKDGSATELRKAFAKNKDLIHADIMVYLGGNSKYAAVSIFCMAVDLGRKNVVDEFINAYKEAGMGSNAVCTVKRYQAGATPISRADHFFYGKSEKFPTTGQRKNWFEARKLTVVSAKSNPGPISTPVNTVYTRVDIDNKTTKEPPSTASPLDFAGERMFDHLWDAGFRSERLFNKEVMFDAKKYKRDDIISYVSNKLAEGYNPGKMNGAVLKEMADNATTAMFSKNFDSYSISAVGEMLSAPAKSADVEKSIKSLEAAKDEALRLQVRMGAPADTAGFAKSIAALEKYKKELQAKESSAAQAKSAASAEALQQKRNNASNTFNARLSNSLVRAFGMSQADIKNKLPLIRKAFAENFEKTCVQKFEIIDWEKSITNISMTKTACKGARGISYTIKCPGGHTRNDCMSL